MIPSLFGSIFSFETFRKPPFITLNAGGYRWNPTFIQLANPQDHGFYSEQCNPKYPLRCEVGDMSGKHGKISVGGRSYVFDDRNLQLHGDWFHNAVGKSILIHDIDGTALACANIEPDNDIIKYAVIRTLSGQSGRRVQIETKHDLIISKIRHHLTVHSGRK